MPREKGEDMLASRVLVATDGSEGARAAEKHAAELALLIPDAKIVVMNVGKVGLLDHPPDILRTGESGETTNHVVEEAIGRISAILGDSGVPVHAKAVNAPSEVEAIITEADREPCGFIVVGNQGRSAASICLLGSVAMGVAEKAHCPVTVAHV